MTAATTKRRPGRPAQATRGPLSPAEQHALVMQFEPMLEHLWKKLNHNHMVFRLGFEEVKQIGFRWLCHAASRFDPSRGVLFKTYAYRCCRGQILSEAARRAALVYVPRQKLWDAARGGEGAAAFKVRSIPQLSREARDGKRTRDDPFEIHQPEGTESSADAEAVALALKRLTRREREAVRLYYWEGMTLAEAGGVMGVTRERVRQMLKQSYAKLRPRLEHLMQMK